MTEKSTNVLVLGAASWNRMVHVEHLPQGQAATILDATETQGAGSTGMGKAMALAAMGYEPTLHCTLGRDDHAARIAKVADARGVRMIVDHHDAPTAQHLNLMDQAGGRYSIFLSNGAADPTIDKQRLSKEINAATTIFLSLAVSSRKVLHLLKDTDAEILLDLHDYDGLNPWYDDFIAHADVIQLSDVALADPRPVIDRLLAGRATQIVLTKAALGATICTTSQTVDVPPCPATLVDSNGAGDAFSVALWAALARGLDVTEAGKFAATAAAFAVEDSSLYPTGVSADDIDARAKAW